MMRRILLTAALAMGITMVGLAARQATLVLKNGERIGGTLQQGSNEV